MIQHPEYEEGIERALYWAMREQEQRFSELDFATRWRGAFEGMFPTAVYLMTYQKQRFTIDEVIGMPLVKEALIRACKTSNIWQRLTKSLLRTRR